MELSILSINVWGLAILSKKRKDRFKIIKNYLETTKPDVVFFQELWRASDLKYLTLEGYTMSRAYSGLVGTGLAIMSKYPLETIYFHEYRYKGSIWSIFEGDWFAGKGFLSVQIRIENQLAYLIDTHFQSTYKKKDHLVERCLQAEELFIYLKTITKPISEENPNIILAGDFNTETNELPFKILEQTGLINIPNSEATMKKKCIDHIFSNLKVQEFKVIEIRNEQLVASDHKALYAKFMIDRLNFIQPVFNETEWKLQVRELMEKRIKEVRKDIKILMILAGISLFITITFALTASIIAMVEADGAIGLTAAMSIISPLFAALSLLFFIFALSGRKYLHALKDRIEY